MLAIKRPCWTCICKTQGTGNRYDTAANYYIIDIDFQTELSPQNKIMDQSFLSIAKIKELMVSQNCSFEERQRGEQYNAQIVIPKKIYSKPKNVVYN